MCQRPAFHITTTTSSSGLPNNNYLSSSPTTQELSSALRIRTMSSKSSAFGKRVRFQPPTLLNSFAEPTYSLNEESKQSMWWTRQELTSLMVMSSTSSSSSSSLLVASQKSSMSPSVSMCLIMFMISNLSILSIAACFLVLDD